MIDPVVIQFSARGMAEVTRAFETVEQRMARAEKNGTTITARESAARVRSSRSEVDNRRKDIEKLARDVAKSQERQARQMEQIRRRSSEMAGREAAKEAAAEIREARKAAREIERLEEWKLRVRLRSAEMAGRAAAAEARKEAQLQNQLGRSGAHGLSRGLSSGVRLAGMAAGALSIGGGFAVGDAVRKQLAAEKQAALLVNTVTTGNRPPDGATVQSILGKASALSATTGMSKEELIGGALEYSRKARGGDFQGAMANMPFFAKMSQVTGADINDIAASAGTLQSQNAALTKDPKAMQQMLLDVYAQGKAGSMSMVDVAKQIGTLASTRGSYAGDEATNQRKLLALGQLAAPEGSVEEAGTYIKDLTSEAGAHRKGSKGKPGLESMGVKFDKYGRMESPEQMIEAVMKSTGGDITKIETIFGKRGTALFRSLQPDYVKAGGGEAGLAAVRKKMASVTSATMTPEQLEAQHAQTMATPAMRLQAAWEKLETTIGDKLEPALEKLADKAPALADAFGKIAEAGVELLTWLADNKWQGLGAIVAASIAKEIAGAQLAKILEGGINESLSGKLTGALAIASAAFTIAEVGMMAIDYIASEDVKQQRANVASDIGAVNEAGDLEWKRLHGKLTSADVNKANEDVAARTAKANGQRSVGALDVATAPINEILKLLAKPVTGGAEAQRDEQDARSRKNAADATDMLRKQAEAAAKALGQMANNAGSVKSNAPGGPIGQGPR